MKTHKWAWLGLAMALAGCSRKNPEPVAQASEGPAIETPQQRSASYAAPAVADPEPARPELVIPRGARLRVRIDEALNTRRNRAGDTFHATLAAPLVSDGQMLLPAGTGLTGHVTDSDSSGRLKGRAVLGVTLDALRRDGVERRIETDRVVRQSASHKKRNFAFIGGGSGLGAAIGAIAGGGTGALIGAAAGAGAGVAADAATGKLEVGLPAETPLTFSLRESVRL